MSVKPPHRIFILNALLVVRAFAADTISYHLAGTHKFAPAGGGREYFDYITFDAGSSRLYLSHGTEVLVVDANSGQELGKIGGLKVSHGTAVVPELGRGFISDGAQGKARPCRPRRRLHSL